MSSTRERVDPREVVGRVSEPVPPIEAEPMDVVLDALDELFRLTFRVRVVEAQETGAAELLGDAEVDADRHRVPDVQIAVRLRRKPRLHAPAVLPRRNLLRNDLADEVLAARRLVRGLVFHGRAFSPNAHDLSAAPRAVSSPAGVACDGCSPGGCAHRDVRTRAPWDNAACPQRTPDAHATPPATTPYWQVVREAIQSEISCTPAVSITFVASGGI